MFGHDENDQKSNDDKSTKINVALGQDDGSSDDSSQSPSTNGPSPDEFDDDSSSSSSNSNDDDTIKPSAPAPTAEDSDLLKLKKEALQSLSPLVGHLDQTPEEKFHTTMMMIQATDNQDLVQAAYEAANNIPDEKVKAQALLDVVNEINYFTQPKDKS